jgi:hypothetical protein
MPHGLTLLIVGSKNTRKWMVIDEATKAWRPWAASRAVAALPAQAVAREQFDRGRRAAETAPARVIGF